MRLFDDRGMSLMGLIGVLVAVIGGGVLLFAGGGLAAVTDNSATSPEPTQLVSASGALSVGDVLVVRKGDTVDFGDARGSCTIVSISQVAGAVSGEVVECDFDSTATPGPSTTTSTPTDHPTPETSTTSTTTVTTPPPTGDGNTITFPSISSLALGSCSEATHDKYAAIVDGNKYRAWHPLNDPSGCSFAHEHGDAPHPDAPPLAFGHAAFKAGSFGMIAAHAGFKCFTHYANGNSGFGAPELDYGGIEMDFTTCIHQGTAGEGRRTHRFHDFTFWSQYQGSETFIQVQADTGGSQCLAGGPVVNADLETQRFLPCVGQHTYEQWTYIASVGDAWNSGRSNFAVTNPVTLLDADNAVTGTFRANCGTNFPDIVFCDVSDIDSGRHFYNGVMRTIHEPDWTWTNGDGAAVFCTNPRGDVQACELEDSIQQRVPDVNLSNAAGRILDRTANAPGWTDARSWPFGGVPGGN